MRIKCPNCDAQYEVPDEVVPAEGRDVQCSGCGQTWFQEHPDHADSAADEYDPDAVMPEPEPLLDDEFDDEEDYQETPLTSPPRKELDPEVEEILREEGGREAAARAAEKEPENLEVQTNLGLDDLEDRFPDTEDQDDDNMRVQEMNERMARMRGEAKDAADDVSEYTSGASNSAGEAAAAAAALGSRRDLLPDIEEINSTLRSTSDRDAAGDDTDPEAPIRNRKKRGFRRGFLLAVLVVVILVLIYLLAPQISNAMPQTEALLSGYTGWVDGLRASLDTRVQGVAQWLDATAAASSSGS